MFFELKKIKPEEAKSDYELNQLLTRNRPLIFGAICDLLAKATTIVKKLQPQRPTRLVDAYTEMLAVAIAMGISEAEFHRLISENIKRLNSACAGSPVVQAVCEYMNGPKAGTRKVVQTSTKFFENVRANYSGQQADLPGRAAEFSKAIKAECASLLKSGFGVLVDDTGATGSVIRVVRYKH